MGFDKRVPLLRPDLEVVNGQASLDDGEYVYRFEDIEPAAFCNVVRCFNGLGRVSVVANQTGMSERFVSILAETIVQHGLAAFTSNDQATIDAAHFCSAVRAVSRKWKQRLFSHQLWVGLSHGSASLDEFRTWLLESYHFIEGVNVRLPVAVANASDRAVQRIFATHFSEEYDHSDFFKLALSQMRVSEEVLSAEPLPSTTALLTHMRWSGRTDALRYAVCSAFLESTGADRAAGRTFFARIADCYTNGAAITAPLRAHLELDEDYGHTGLLERLAESFGPISVARATAAIDAGAMLLETLLLWSTDIQRSAGAPPGSLVYRPGARHATNVRRGEVGSRVLVSSSVEFASTRGRLVATSDTDIYEFTVPASDEIRQILDCCDGRLTPAAENKATGEALSAIVQELCEDGLAIDAAALPAADNHRFVERYMDEARFWAREVVGAPFFKRLNDGSLSRNEVLGWGIEMTHYVTSANTHMARGVSECTDRHLRRKLAKHFVDEANHDKMFVQGLVACGLDERMLRTSRQLPSTVALINFLNELATADLYAYLATFGVMQQAKTPRTASGIRSCYDALRNLYPCASALFDAFEAHALIDFELEHDDLLLQWQLQRLPPNEEQRRSIVRGVRGIARSLLLFFEGIVDWYGSETAPLIRRSSDTVLSA